MSLILYLVSPGPVPATDESSADELFVYVCANLAPLAPPAAVSFAMESDVPSPQSTSNVQLETVFVVVLSR